eukprot:Nitzschia sp. Nitz4//scaffold252_size28738//2066//4663//NITZ4_008092-RA/size28738-processed-gene-0.23-mRNA-1//-1//CDS//3329544254//6600//frame0
MVSPIHKMNSVSRQQQQQPPSSSLRRSRRNLFASDSNAGVVTPPLDSPTQQSESSPQKSTASAKQLFPKKRPLRNRQQPQPAPTTDPVLESRISVAKRSTHHLSTKASTTALDSLANLLSPVSTAKLPISTPPSNIPADILSVLTPQPSSPSAWKRLPHSIDDVFEQHRARRQLEFPPRKTLRRSCKESVPSYIEVEEDEGLQQKPLRQPPNREQKKPPDLPLVIPTKPTAVTTTNQSVSEPSSISLSRSSVPPAPSSVSSVKRNHKPKKKPLARNMRRFQSSVASSQKDSSFLPKPVVPTNQRTTSSQKVDVLADAPPHKKPPSPRKSPATKSPPAVTPPVATAPVRSIVKTKHTPDVERSKSYKKIRFAPLPTTTTTFSVKIRVQTSANNGSSSSSLPSMDQSTVQSIASQIAQACLTTDQPSLPNNANQTLATGTTQSPAGITPGESPMAPPDDVPWSESSDSESEGEEEETARKAMPPPATTTKETPGYKRHRNRGRHDEYVELDVRSVASEITMDVDLTRGAMGLLGHSTPSNETRGSTRKRRSPSVSSLPPPPLGLSPPVASAPTDSLAAPPEPQAVVSPVGKKRRRLTGNDSLAGCSLASLPMEPVAAAKLPTQVEFASRSPSRSRSRGEHANVLQNLVEDPKVSGRRRPTEVAAETNIDETVVTDRSVDTRRSNASEGRCGTCSGCRQVLDCLTCRKCVASLQRGIATGRRTGCLKRQCRARRFTGTESLGRSAEGDRLMQTAQSVNDDEEDDEFEFGEASEAASVTSSVSKRQAHRIKQWHRRWNKEERKETESLPPIGVTAPPLTRGRRKKKNAKNPLHYLELPMPTDGSVASYLEGKRCLRALMHYDEADQDWV